MGKLIVLIVLAAFNLILGTFILTGKCDSFVLGCFHFSSTKEEEKFYIGRLRILMGVFLIILAPLFFLLTIEGAKWAGYLFSTAVWTMLIAYYILVYTWAII